MTYLFNTTFTVSLNMQQGWQAWMIASYIPAMRAVAPNATHETYVIDGSISDGSLSYSSQWRCSTISELADLREVSTQLCQDVMQTHGENCLAFSTMMKGLDF